jgi:hypothetical protein
MKNYQDQIGHIVIHLLGTDIRMEQTGLQITSAVFERIGIFSDELLAKVLTQIFTFMHFYRNSTRSKVIPAVITRAIHIFFATFMISFGSERLIKACDGIQANILFMILKSEGEKIKLCSAPIRDRKYVIAAYTNLFNEFSGKFVDESLKTVISALVELCRKDNHGAFITASRKEGSVEEMLDDGAIDQTFAFQRESHVQLYSCKTE